MFALTLRMFNAWSMPSNPYDEKAYKNGLPTPTAVAPSAIAFNTSFARRTPPSTNSWNFSFGNVSPRRALSSRVTSTRTSIAERENSSCRPPWFESTTPARPWS